jgi:hypothetical protein
MLTIAWIAFAHRRRAGGTSLTAVGEFAPRV